MENVCYIGIDLGDKTLSINEAKSGYNNAPAEVNLPGQNGNQPIQSVVGFLESGEVILADRFDNIPVEQFTRILANFKRRPSSIASSAEEQEFCDGVKTLLNIVLESEVTRQAVKGLAQNSGEIVFCVGYPTNWNEQDITIYEGIVRLSVLGKYARDGKFLDKPVRLIFERESTAAFVYIKLLSNKLFKITKSDKVLLFDFGSSTLNVTALTTDSRTTLYNSGHNYFGGRFIDCIIADYYLEMIKEKERKFFEKFNRDSNGIGSMLLLLAASEAKERLSDAELTRINLLDIKSSVKLTHETLNMLLKRPMAPIISKYGFIPDCECNKFGNMGWIDVLQSYLKQERIALTQKRIQPNIVILTGGGAILYAVQDACRDIFGEIQTLDARDSTKTISKGLALAAKRADQSAQFDRDVQEFIDNRLERVIEDVVPSLAKPLSADIAAYMCDEMVIPELISWRKGYVSTLDTATAGIKSKCGASDFSSKLQNNNAVKKTVKNWSMNTLGIAIAKELENICNKNNVKNFELGDLNVIKVPTIDVSGSNVVPVAQMDFLANIIAGITGIIAITIAPGLLILILEIIALIMPGLALLIVSIIAAIPGGIFILAGIAGVASFKLIKNGWESVKNDVLKGISKADIPELARKAVSESKIRSSVYSSKPDIEIKIYESMISYSNVQSIARQTGSSLTGQVRAKMDEIRYLMENN